MAHYFSRKFVIFLASISLIALVDGASMSYCQRRQSCEDCFRTRGCVYIYGVTKGSKNASLTCSNKKFIRYRPIFRVKSMKECDEHHLLQRINSSVVSTGHTQWKTADTLMACLFYSVIIVFVLFVSLFCREAHEE